VFDTHCHLNFKAFAGKEEEIVKSAQKAGIQHIMIPGTDVKSSKKAIELAERFEGAYAAVGIHPHHIYKLKVKSQNLKVREELLEIEKILSHPKVVAVGEVGLDRHIYKKTVYNDYQVDEKFVALQKQFFLMQLKLAHKYKKALIIHNREATDDLLRILSDNRSLITDCRMVFHCCEPEQELLDFAVKHKIFLGVDGDITYQKDKQEFIQKFPSELLVLETDSPFLLPEPLRSKRTYPNEPKNLKIVAEFIAKIIGVSLSKLENITEENSKKLFQLN